MMKYVFLLLIGFMQACSTTSSDARSILNGVSMEDKAIHSAIALTITSADLITSSQDSGRLYKLHETKEEINQLATNIARLYGFNMVEPKSAEFEMSLKLAQPDGGACVEGFGVAAKGISFSASILTLGISPATSSHCFVVVADLHYIGDASRELVGEFTSNAGRVEVYAGANEVDNYQLTVTRHDEEKALEASFAGLFQRLIEDEIFK